MLALATAAAPSSGCASKLSRGDVAKNVAGDEQEIPLDMRTIVLGDLASGGSINVGEYMAAHDRDFLLLTFGSQGCTACNAKGKYLTEHVINQHPLYLTDEGQRFEIIGVNTDGKTADELGSYLARLPFVRWEDTGGAVMRASLMPADMPFGVPFTAMVSRNGIAWRILPTDHVSVSDMMAKVTHTLGLDATVVQPPAPEETPTPVPTPPPLPPASALTKRDPGRLGGTSVTTCDGATKVVAELAGPADFAFVSVVTGACDATCAAARAAEADAAVAACRSAGRACSATILAASYADGACRDARFAVGGAAFATTFKSFFDWRYPRQTTMQGMEFTRGVEGPLLFAFAADGTVAFAHELAAGESGAALVTAAASAAAFGAPAPAVDFAVYDKANGTRGFSAVARQARYTVVNAFGALPVPCGSCMAELTAWSQPQKGLLDWCAARPVTSPRRIADCQVLALDGSSDPYKAMPEYYDALIGGDPEYPWDGLAKLGVRVPVLLDPLMFDLNAPIETHFFDGYMTALDPSQGMLFRTVVFDEEGKVVGILKSEEPVPGQDDPTMAFLKGLLSRGP
jgi:hypothetical protein